MKLRLRGDSIRIRLTKTELVALRDQGWCEEAAHFGPEGGPRLVYRVESAGTAQPSVRFTSGTDTLVTVVLPASDVAPWVDNAQVGLYFEEPWGLKVAIEKDFRCLSGRVERAEPRA